MTVSAPGKILLLGDYAVLDGGTALVAAVSSRATGRVVDSPPPPSPVVRAVLERAAEDGYELEGGLEIDTSDFKDADGNKLGLGSSAATAVVAASLATRSGDEHTLRIAVDGHRAASGGSGSGVDVAASFYGGVIATHVQPAPVDPLPSKVGELIVSVLFTGQSSSTPDMVKTCRASPKWNEWMSVMKPLAEEGVTAWLSQNPMLFLQAVSKYGRALKGLGKDAGVPIVTEQIDDIMRLAGEGGAAAKPSGAGGGDVVVLFGRDPELAPRIAEQTGARVLDLEVDRRGLARK